MFVVRKREDLLTKVIPFFEAKPLLSSKQQDFLTFARVVRAMDEGVHLTAEGLFSLATQAVSMNGAGRYRRAHGTYASRILRDHMPNTARSRSSE